jgi:tricarballylate dehydrogenase
MPPVFPGVKADTLPELAEKLGLNAATFEKTVGDYNAACRVGKFMPPVFPPVRASTLAELAGAFELDASALESTVREFNAAVRPGTFDHTIFDDCRTEGLTPAKTHWARPLDTPPFFGYPLRPGITFTYLGVAIDDRARMLMADGGACENAFAAGEIMAGNVLGKGYLAGIGMAIGTTYGRIAGAEAAQLVRA